ncbi:hypothetical protein Q2T41_03055 [Maribacter confluentis]|uniref:Uncharacterized protein n=1 Tax=Maribacter confluentis TaxID=1656093 RepID=A0ABT8RL56_9FLAO|nr:hypothetical protein [Maribacter confluentis]MDO1511644.1 hypothetical protein [Maribacter confluentis]
MRITINLPAGQAGQPPTESRRFTFLTHLKDSKRIRWAESRQNLH